MPPTDALFHAGLSRKYRPGRSPGIRNRLEIGISCLVLVLLFACARVEVSPPAPLLDEEAMASVISECRMQQRLVDAVASSGSLRLKIPGKDRTFSLFMAGKRDPLTVKIEVTHSWGGPVLHILVSGERVRMVSFAEERYYHGRLDSGGFGRFLPGAWTSDDLWSLVRGYPALREYRRAVSVKGNEIRFLGEQGRTLQTLGVKPDSGLPRTLMRPQSGLRMTFGEYRVEEEGRIRYATEMEISREEEDSGIALCLRQVLLNVSVPEEVFELSVPPAFEEHRLQPSP